MPELNLNDLNTAPELTLDAPAEPSLTLDPAADEAAEQAAQQEAKKVEPVTVEDTPLSPEERKMVADFAEKIDVTNSQQVMQYGSACQKKIGDFSETALSKVRTKDLGTVGDALSSLLMPPRKSPRAWPGCSTRAPAALNS